MRTVKKNKTKKTKVPGGVVQRGTRLVLLLACPSRRAGDRDCQMRATKEASYLGCENGEEQRLLVLRPGVEQVQERAE